ncbi:MAG: hypothetical protein KUG77_03125 [Nannocystaceae bacterium]|nr:hypothetical protein [Nannocystaceae bacterium]
MTTQSKERRKGRSTAGRVSGIRFDWDAHGAEGYAVDVQERSHEDSGDLIAAKIRRDWSEGSAEPPEAEEAASDSEDESADAAKP